MTSVTIPVVIVLAFPVQEYIDESHTKMIAVLPLKRPRHLISTAQRS